MYKFSSNDLNAFDSPNFAPLVHGMLKHHLPVICFSDFFSLVSTVGIEIDVDWNNVIRQTGLRRFKAHKRKTPIGTFVMACIYSPH